MPELDSFRVICRSNPRASELRSAARVNHFPYCPPSPKFSRRVSSLFGHLWWTVGSNNTQGRDSPLGGTSHSPICTPHSAIETALHPPPFKSQILKSQIPVCYLRIAFCIAHPVVLLHQLSTINYQLSVLSEPTDHLPSTFLNSLLISPPRPMAESGAR